MQTSYIYSVSRVNTLKEFLLNKTDIERLLVAQPGADMQLALKETYLAPYIAHVPGEDVSLAIEQTLIDAKRIIHRIAPAGDMLRVLWIQYDIHNLRVLAKATANNLTFDDCKSYLSDRGVYEVDYLFNHAEEKTLDSLQSNWQAAYNQAVQAVADNKLNLVDGIFDELYFVTSKQIVQTAGDSFMQKYLAQFIDLYNLKSRLRHLHNESVQLEPAFVAGGTFGPDQIETLEDTLATFARYGGSEFWRVAIEYYQSTGNTTSIDARSGESMLLLAKEGSYDMFSSASLVLYYLKCRQAAANVRIIVVGKNSGAKESAIRANLRMAYVHN